MDVGSPFGSRSRTRILLALEQGESYPRELARLLAAPLSVVQKAVRSLERDEMVTGRMLGRTRLLELNPGYFALAALRVFLAELGQTKGLEVRAAVRRSRSRGRARSPETRAATGARASRPRPETLTGGGGEKWRVW